MNKLEECHQQCWDIECEVESCSDADLSEWDEPCPESSHEGNPCLEQCYKKCREVADGD